VLGGVLFGRVAAGAPYAAAAVLMVAALACLGTTGRAAPRRVGAASGS
jgi:hypothetical protein